MDPFLGLGGLAVLGALLQSKTLPSEKEYLSALNTLNFKADDPAANLIVGKYKTFVESDFIIGLPYLVKGSDKTLAALAQKEIDEKNVDSAEKQVVLGDEWVSNAKKYPALATAFYDHASEWYASAWPKLNDAWKAKVREQGKRLAAPRPPGPQRKEFPSGWVLDTGAESKPAEVEHMVSHLGSYSIKIPPSKNPGTYNAFNSVLTPISGDVIEVTAYVRSDGTENGEDTFRLYLTNENGAVVVQKALVPVDLPVWKKVTISSKIPKNANRAHFFAAIFSKQGNLWVDDVSIKVDGKEILKNGSFEGK